MTVHAERMTAQENASEPMLAYFRTALEMRERNQGRQTSFSIIVQGSRCLACDPGRLSVMASRVLKHTIPQALEELGLGHKARNVVEQDNLKDAAAMSMHSGDRDVSKAGEHCNEALELMNGVNRREQPERERFLEAARELAKAVKKAGDALGEPEWTERWHRDVLRTGVCFCPHMGRDEG